MDFIEQIRAFAAGVPGRAEAVQTEEATKTALILPFFRVLGYDTSDPREVVPEFTADFGTKKGQRVDYAIFKDNRPVILVECKAAGANLDQEHASQLFQYFAATDASRVSAKWVYNTSALDVAPRSASSPYGRGLR